jgi:AcrR family transcriptional regulator
MATTRAMQAEETRRTILDTARRLFAERGYDATSLQEIADAMGVRKANVYYYFKTKDAILVTLLEVLTAPVGRLLDEVEAEQDLVRRRGLLAAGYASIVVTAYRDGGPLNLGDPGVRRVPEAARMLDELSERALRLLFGSDPTTDQRVSLTLVLDLGAVLRQLSELSDDDARATVERLCHRVVAAV